MDNVYFFQYNQSAVTGYLQTMGPMNIISIIVTYCLVIMFGVSSDIWMKNWTDHANANNEVFFWLSGYSAISTMKGMYIFIHMH